MPRWTRRTDVTIDDEHVEITAVGTRQEGKHPSRVLREARVAVDAGKHATVNEAVDAFYEEYSGRRVSDEVTEADVDRRNKTKQRMRSKLQGMGSSASSEPQ